MTGWLIDMVSVGQRKPFLLQPFRGATRHLRRVSVGGLRRLQYTSLLLTRSYWGLMYAFNWWDIIDEHFVLGGAMMFDDLDRLQGLGVDAVLNLCAERSDNRHQLDNAGIAYLWLPVIDVCPPTLDQIMQGIGWIEQQLRANRTIYIHCAVGVGRSATLLACWLLYAKRMNVAQALRFLKTRRPQVGLTRLQVRRLEEFEGWLRTGRDNGIARVAGH